MRSVCLVRVPNFLLHDEKLQAPLGIVYLAGFLRQHGVEVRICDLAGEPRERWADLLPAGCDIYGLSLTTGDMSVGSEVAALIRRLYPRSLLVAGGAHPSALPNDTLTHGFNVAVVGPGEAPLLELACDGLRERVVRGRVPDSLYGLPMPAWDLIPDIISYNLVEKGEPASCVFSSMGCPMRCAFCAQDVWSHCYLERPLADVERELLCLKSEYGVTEVRLVDELTMAKRERFIELCKTIGSLGLKWRTHTRADLACRNKDLLPLARDNGLVELAVGVENPDDHILKMVNKRVTSAQCAEAIQAIKDAGIRAKAYFIIGLPGESWETVENMRRWIREVKPHRTTLSTFVPYPRCAIWEDPERYGYRFLPGARTDWRRYWILGYEESDEPFIGETEGITSEELVRARRELYEFMLAEGYKEAPPNDASRALAPGGDRTH